MNVRDYDIKSFSALPEMQRNCGTEKTLGLIVEPNERP
jgi:hypothetical protein